MPKFLQEDLKLFSGIVSDLFPTIKEEDTDYGILDKAIRKACEKSNLKDVDGEPWPCPTVLWALEEGWVWLCQARSPASGSLTPGQACCRLGLSAPVSTGTLQVMGVEEKPFRLHSHIQHF